MRFRVLVAALAGFAVFGCSGEPPPIPTADQALVSLAYEEIVSALRDPASAQFSELKLGGEGQRRSVCGRVNSRNGFGGMSGARRFVRRFTENELTFADRVAGQRGDQFRLAMTSGEIGRWLDSTQRFTERGPKPRTLFIEPEARDIEFESEWLVSCAVGRATTAVMKPLPPTPPKA